MHVSIRVACEKDFVQHMADGYLFDLVDIGSLRSYRVHRKTPFEEFKELISQDLRVPKHLQRFWSWIHRSNERRVDKALEQADIDIEAVMDLRHIKDKKITESSDKSSLLTVELFLETPEAGCDALRPIVSSEQLIFLKLYKPRLQKLSYVGHLFIETTDQFESIFRKAGDMAGLSSEVKVVGFEEVQSEPSVICKELSLNETPTVVIQVSGSVCECVCRQRLTMAPLSLFKSISLKRKQLKICARIPLQESF